MRILSIIILCFALIGCSASEHRDWAFMQAVGGLTVAGQDKNPGWLIIHGDVSGLKEFSNKPTQLNSALAVKRVEAGVHDSTIQIYVLTTLVSDRNKNTEISGVQIPVELKGRYMVQYKNPDGTIVDLKEVTFY